jgi:hypothetical protein
VAIKAQYQSGFDLGGQRQADGSRSDGSGNVQVQIGFGETVGQNLVKGGINLFAGIGYSTRDGIVESVSACELLGNNVSDCPSSDDLRLIGRFEKGGSGSSGVEVRLPAADAASGDLRWCGA